jgi:hypothetical protein
MNLSQKNIDKHVEQYFSAKRYKIIYLLHRSTHKDSKSSSLSFFMFFLRFTMQFQSLQLFKIKFKLEKKLFRNSRWTCNEYCDFRTRNLTTFILYFFICFTILCWFYKFTCANHMTKFKSYKHAPGFCTIDPKMSSRFGIWPLGVAAAGRLKSGERRARQWCGSGGVARGVHRQPVWCGSWSRG